MKEMERLKKAFVPASDDFRNHMKATLDNMEDLTMKKTRRHISALAVVLAILLLAGVALAAAHFGVLDFIAHRDAEGNAKFNQELSSHVQPIGQTLEGTAAKVTLHDAICDGANLSFAWTIQNKLPDETVFVYWYPVIGNGDVSYSAGAYTPNEFLLEGGEVKEGGVTATLLPFAKGDTLPVDIHFSILMPEREIITVGDENGYVETEEEARKAEHIEEYLEEGKIVRDRGMFRFPHINYLEDEPYDETLVRLGYMRKADTFLIPLELNVTSGMTDILAHADKTEIDMGDYQVVLASIEYAPTTLYYTVNYLFDNETGMNAFRKERKYMGLFPIFDESDIWYGLAETTDMEEPGKEEGQWVLHYDCIITDILVMPEGLEIVPHDAMTKEPYHPDERFYVKIP